MKWTQYAYVTRVIVRRDLTGECFDCWWERRAFKCGACKRGNLGPSPVKGDRCRVCHNPVSHVLLSTDIAAPSPPKMESQP